MKILAYITLAAALCACDKTGCEITDKIFAFGENTAAHQAVNKMLREKFTALKSGVIAEAKALGKDPETAHIKCELAAETTVYINKPEFFSARNDYYTYTGGAHGHAESEGFNIVFNRDGSVTRLGLFDVVDENKAEEFAKLVRAELGSKYAGMVFVEEIRADSALLQSIRGFAIRKDGMEIFFEKYSVAAGACGTAPILIGNDMLRGICKKNICDFAK